MFSNKPSTTCCTLKFTREKPKARDQKRIVTGQNSPKGGGAHSSKKIMTQPKAKAWAETVRRQGYVVIPGICTPEQCEKVKSELWSIIEELPRRPEARLRRPAGPRLTKKEIKHLRDHWLPHKAFGAPCEPPMFHLQEFYRIRQDPQVYQVFAELLGQKELYTELNRPKMVLPGEGDEELCHWDADPFHWDNDGRADTLGFHCLVAFSDLTTVFSTETTWTKEWVTRFRELYAPLRNAEPQAKVHIKDHDPLNLRDKWQYIKVPAGSIIIWSNKLLHSSYKNTSDQIIYGMYHGYQKAEDRKEMANPELGLNQTEDRLRAYKTGQMPYKYPSGDKTHYIPARWQNFPKIVASYQRRLPQDCEQAQQTRILQYGPNKGKVVPFMYEPLPVGYHPPPLSDLGKRLMGIEAWPDSQETHVSQKKKRKTT